MEYVACFDFDGTLIYKDLAYLILKQFGEEGWEHFNDLYEDGKISLEENLIAQFSLIRTPIEKLLDFIEPFIETRSGLKDLLAMFDRQRVKLIITSAGLDFLIRFTLKQIEMNIDWLICAKSRYTPNGIVMEYPEVRDPQAVNFKDETVLKLQSQGLKVFYFGDGFSDLEATKRADFSFVVRNSSLEKLCLDQGVLYTPFSSFSDLGKKFDEIFSEGQF